MYCPYCPFRAVHKLESIEDEIEGKLNIYKCSMCREKFELPMSDKPLTLLMIMGLPSSGKTTYSRSIASSVPNHVRVSKKDIRNELKWDDKNPDAFIKLNAIRDMQITEALTAGKCVISDDCNFDPADEVRLREIAKECKAEFKKQFLNTPLQECMRRNSFRLLVDRIEPIEIRQMAEKYRLYPKVEPVDVKSDPDDIVEIVAPAIIAPVSYDFPIPLTPLAIDKVGKGYKKVEPNDSLMSAVIVNLDCLSIWNKDKREFCEYDKAHSDNVNQTVKKIIMTLHKYLNYQIIYMSGRTDVYMSPSIRFLTGNMCPQGPLYMRKRNDGRQEWIVFGDMFEQHIRDHYDVKLVLDNDKDTVDFWRSIGLTVFQTDEGNF